MTLNHNCGYFSGVDSGIAGNSKPAEAPRIAAVSGRRQLATGPAHKAGLFYCAAICAAFLRHFAARIDINA